METHVIRIYAFVQAAVARIEGMKAENAQRAACGESPAYTEGDFAILAGHIESLAREL